MWRMKVTAVSVVVLGALLFGAVVAYAGWGWNAKVDIGGTKVGTSWSVTNDNNGAADYHAEITLTVPSNVDVNVIKLAPRENLTVVRTGEVCVGTDINAVVSYVITSNGDGDGTDVSVSVDRVGGGGKMNYGSSTGSVGEAVSVNVAMSGECNG